MGRRGQSRLGEVGMGRRGQRRLGEVGIVVEDLPPPTRYGGKRGGSFRKEESSVFLFCAGQHLSERNSVAVLVDIIHVCTIFFMFFGRPFLFDRN